MKTLVTGAAGFIGMHVTKKLLEDQFDVIGLDNLNDYYDIKLKEDRLKQLQAFKNFRFIALDIADKIAVEKIFNEEKFAFAKGAVTETVKQNHLTKTTLTEKFDSILIHKFLGLPIFLFFMWGLFQLTFEIGNIPMEIIDSFFAMVIDKTKELLKQKINPIIDKNLSNINSDNTFKSISEKWLSKMKNEWEDSTLKKVVNFQHSSYIALTN